MERNVIKKLSIVFAILMNLINVLAGVVTQLTLLFEWDFVSLIPITEMGTQQILFINLFLVSAVVSLISLVIVILIEDFSFNIKEVFSSCPALSLLIPCTFFILSIYTTLGASSTKERIICLVISAVYILFSVVGFGSLSVLISSNKKDSE